MIGLIYKDCVVNSGEYVLHIQHRFAADCLGDVLVCAYGERRKVGAEAARDG